MQRIITKQLINSSRLLLSKGITNSQKLWFSVQERETPPFYILNSDLPYEKTFNVAVNSFEVHKSGFIRVNQQHKQNVLGKKFLKSLRQNIELQITDEHLRGVLLDTESAGDTLCKGLDLKYIYYELAQNKNSQVVYDYLKEIYAFYEELSQINKPLLVMLQGHLINASSVCFTLANMPISNDTTVIRFNETELGGVPCSGSSFYLSRLPGELGVYLALTGESLEGEEVFDAGFSVRHITEHRRDIHDSFIKAIRDYEPDKPSFYQHNDQLNEAWMKRTQQQLASKDWMLQEFKERIVIFWRFFYLY